MRDATSPAQRYRRRAQRARSKCGCKRRVRAARRNLPSGSANQASGAEPWMIESAIAAPSSETIAVAREQSPQATREPRLANPHPWTRVDINIKVAHPACLRSACLRPLRRGDAKWRLRPRLSLAKDVNATAVVGRAASLAEASNGRATSSVAVLDDWRSEPTFLLNRAPAGHGRCAGSVRCA